MSARLGPVQAARRLVVNADDLGRSPSINEAVARAHREGILTTASLMVNEPWCEPAVDMARAHPALGVGLHLTLVMGRAGLPLNRIPGLVDARGQFRSSGVGCGFRYFFNRRLRGQLREEMREQFRRFRETGLELDHVNGHLNLHLHPVILDLLLQELDTLDSCRVRLTRDPLRLNLSIARGRMAYRASHAVVFRVLSARARNACLRRGIRHTRHVFGLLQNAQVDEAFVLRLLRRLPPGDSELYSHPSLDEFPHEFEALVSPAVKRRVAEAGIGLIRYQDL